MLFALLIFFFRMHFRPFAIAQMLFTNVYNIVIGMRDNPIYFVIFGFFFYRKVKPLCARLAVNVFQVFFSSLSLILGSVANDRHCFSCILLWHRCTWSTNVFDTTLVEMAHKTVLRTRCHRSYALAIIVHSAEVFTSKCWFGTHT